MTNPVPELSAAQLVALELADAIIIDPAGVTPELRTRLHEYFSHEQIIELSLDVLKWSYQKVAVALGVDKEIVPGELTDLIFDENGNWIRPTT